MKKKPGINFKLPYSIMVFVFAMMVSGNSLYAQLITNPNTKAGMQHMLAKQKQLSAGRSKQLFDVYKTPLTASEKQALDYLYAYMPLSDLADYDGGFFLKQVKSVLKARSEMPWGQRIPEDVFLHFVLPPRVNNENLDQFRTVMYDEIKKRIAGMNMHDAALEVNHWCHEKVTYRGSDERTSAPLASVKTSFGRCGEESTFTVTALRTVGIPARQVYTPRWAHSDDNHAWVEVWVDGKWHFMGACEPDAGLDMGWFAEPARRAMLVHTRAFGAYAGNEPVIDRQQRFAELNLIQNYAAAKSIFVKVLSTDGKPVANASVEYQLYNYCEFYPIAKAATDSKGMSSIITGLGDLLIWAYQGEKWGYKKISVDKMDSVTVVITDKHPASGYEVFDFIPPVEKVPLPATVTEAQRVNNTVRLHHEDSIRTAYMETFKDSAWVSGFAAAQGMDAERLLPVFRNAFGNWQQIADFISATPATQKDWALRLLEAISEKDIRDTKADILRDHLLNSLKKSDTSAYANKDFFANYVMSGRIANEMMLPWRGFLQAQFDDAFAKQIKNNPEALVSWINSHIKINDTANMHSRAPLSPRGVFELRVSDSHSRDIFFVAMCRSFGLAARINAASGIPQYFRNGEWYNVAFGALNNNVGEKAYVHFINGNPDFEPLYAVNFTIARYQASVYRTIEFEYGTKIGDFENKVEVNAGKYLLVTGNRQADGSVLSSVTFFEVPANMVTDVNVTIRRNFAPVVPWAKINMASYVFENFGSKLPVALDKIASPKGVLLVWIDPDKEPSKHVMADIPAVKDLIGKWGGGVVILLPDDKASPSFKPENFKNLPAQRIFAFDKALMLEIEKLRQRNCRNNLPLIVIADADGNLIYYSEGYKIGIGEQIAKAIAPLK